MLPSLEEAIAAIKAGEKAKGRQMLADILQADYDNELAWLWMSSVAGSDEERRKCLLRVIDINPDNKAARRGLAVLEKKLGPISTDTGTTEPKPKTLSERLGEPAPSSAPPPVEQPADPDQPPAPSKPLRPTPPNEPDEPDESKAEPDPADVPAGGPEPEQSPPAEDIRLALGFEAAPPPVEPEPEPDLEIKDDEPVSQQPPSDQTTKRVVEFINTERGLLWIIGGTAGLIVLCVACVVFNLVFRPIAVQLSPTVAAAIGTDTPTATFTPVTPSATPTSTSTQTPTVTPTLTPSPPGTRVVSNTATPTPTLTRTPTPNPNEDTALVVGVLSGDVIAVIDEENEAEVLVKYIMADAPAVNDPELGTEPFGLEAQAANRELVLGQTVNLERDAREFDEEGRLLRYVYVGDVMVNERLIRQGLARVALNPPNTKYGARLQEAERAAQEENRGIWSLE